MCLSREVFILFLFYFRVRWACMYLVFLATRGLLHITLSSPIRSVAFSSSSLSARCHTLVQVLRDPDLPDLYTPLPHISTSTRTTIDPLLYTCWSLLVLLVLN